MRKVGARYALFAAIVLVPTEAEPAETRRSRPETSELRQRVESFAEKHREFALEASDLDRLVRALRPEAGRARPGDLQSSRSNPASSRAPERLKHDRSAGVADQSIVKALHELGFAARRPALPEGGSGGTGSISGKVTDAVSTLPLDDVYVDIYDSSGNYVTYGYTAFNGTYSTDKGLAAGTHYATVYGYSNYLSELYDNLPCWTGCDATTGTGIPVSEGTTTTGIDFALDQGGTISGSVTDSVSSQPIVDVQVEIYDASGDQVTTTYPETDGSYETNYGLPSGTYYARTDNYSGHLDELYNNLPCVLDCDVTAGTGISVTAGATSGGVDFALAPGGRVGGTITDSDSALPIEDAEVDVVDENGYYVTYGYAASNGTYLSRKGLPTGTYYARTYNWDGYPDELYDNLPCWDGCDETAGTGIPVTAGATSGGIDFALEKGGKISGTVTESPSALPIEGVEISIYDSGGSWVGYGYTSSDGTYEVDDGFPTGTYYAATDDFSGHLDELYDNLPCALGCDVTTGAGISVTTGATTGGINFALAIGGTLGGTITDAVTGLPLEDRYVGIYDASDDWVGYGYSSSDGTYECYKGLPTGSYYARYSGSDDYRGALYSGLPCPFGNCSPSSGAPVAVTVPLVTPGIDFALKRRFLAADGFESGGCGAWSDNTAGPVCAHAMCEEGDPLDGACDPCVAQIVADNSDCGDTYWYSSCVRATYSLCGVTTCEWE